jgi:hypothetical protein
MAQQQRRSAAEWREIGRRMAAGKAAHRRAMGSSIEILPIVTVPTGCGLLVLVWPVLALLWLLGLNTTTDPGAKPPPQASLTARSAAATQPAAPLRCLEEHGPLRVVEMR